MSGAYPYEPSVLDDLGEEITGIAWPVSVCMAVTIFLVRVLNPTGSSSSSTVFIASAAYDENANVRRSSAGWGRAPPCWRRISAWGRLTGGGLQFLNSSAT